MAFEVVQKYSNFLHFNEPFNDLDFRLHSSSVECKD